MPPSSGGEMEWSVRSMAERADECVIGRPRSAAFFAALARFFSFAARRRDVYGEDSGL